MSSPVANCHLLAVMSFVETKNKNNIYVKRLENRWNDMGIKILKGRVEPLGSGDFGIHY